VTKHDAERKRKILDYIAATLRTRGYPPSVREIAVAVDLASTSAVHHHLQMLEREGYLERGASQSRALRLTPTAALRLGLVDIGADPLEAAMRGSLSLQLAGQGEVQVFLHDFELFHPFETKRLEPGNGGGQLRQLLLVHLGAGLKGVRVDLVDGNLARLAAFGFACRCWMRAGNQ